MRRLGVLVLAAAACSDETHLSGDAGNDAPDAVLTSCVGTSGQARGPSYLEGAPMRADLNPLSWLGEPLTIVGLVLAPDCHTPVPGALLDVWSADPLGNYDGGELDPDGDPTPDPAWPLRGVVETDETAHYEFHTLYPGAPPERTRQIHLIVTAEGFATLTTQIYFLGVEENDRDAAFDPALAVPVHDHGEAGLHVVFPIVLSE